jgi:anti-anti-sigma regulatory factor
MMKITTVTNAESITLQLEGRLAGPWVQELERCWVSSVADTRKRESFFVDLSAVTYVDSEGKDLLKRLHRQGAKLVASGCFTNCLVNDISQDARVGERTK